MHTKFGLYNFWRKKFSCIMHPDFLEFVAAKFILFSTFCQFLLTKSKNSDSLKDKIYIVFRANTWTCSYKNPTSLG